jgi:signal transduction histidine kinase/ActR/RegA family two-component response regulator
LADRTLRHYVILVTAKLDLGAVFDASPNPYMVLDADLRYVAVNQAYLRVTSRTREELIGRQILEVFPHDPTTPNNVSSQRLVSSLRRVLATGETDVLPVIHYRILVAGAYQDRYWSATNAPVRDANGRVSFVLQHTMDITDLHEHRLALVRRSPVVEASILDRAEQIQQRHDALDQARVQAEEANLLKDQFLAIISHELRTPLTAILGWLRMLRSGMLSPEKQAHALETVERNARVQAQLIEDLLDVSRIMSGKLALDKDVVDVAPLVSSAMETVRPDAEARGVSLAVEIDASAQVLGDARRLQQVVWNLLSNAVKFTPRDGKVRLQVARSDRAIEIVVHDTGTGISPAFLPHVFERFRQAEGGTARKMGGLGLGLSIVRHVVEAHGGEVRADSGGDGRGATFTVRLPALSRFVPKRRDVPDRAFQAPPALATMTVLIVDDEEDTREYLRALLAYCKADVTVASSSAEAFEALRTRRPDVLLSDIAMPEEDGYGLIQRVRALPPEQGGRTPAVALTAFAHPEDRTRAMLAGFQNYVTKPVEPVELLAAVAALAPGRG